MPFSIKEMDQTTWACYQLPNDSYYYGQIGYLDESGIVHPKQNLEAANNTKNKLAKHGFGIYLEKVNAQTSKPETKYQGYWDKDQKSGRGQLFYSTGLSYEGNFHEGHYHGNGKMVWPNGDHYEGNWKRSKMDGSGVFKHASGFFLKGIFKNNYFVDDQVLRNPFLSEKQYGAFKKQRKQILKQKQKQQKIKHGFSSKIQKQEPKQLEQSINKSISNNRVPLILSSSTADYDFKGLLASLAEFYGETKINILDLRKMYTLKGEQRWEYSQKIHQSFRQSLINGQIFVVNLDESQSQFNEMFYPDIKQFYDSNGFNSVSWSKDQLKLAQVQRKLFGDSVFRKIDDRYKLLVWTKYKVDSNLSEQFIKQKLQLKFDKIIPFIKIDCIILSQSTNSDNATQ